MAIPRARVSMRIPPCGRTSKQSRAAILRGRCVRMSTRPYLERQMAAWSCSHVECVGCVGCGRVEARQCAVWGTGAQCYGRVEVCQVPRYGRAYLAAAHQCGRSHQRGRNTTQPNFKQENVAHRHGRTSTRPYLAPVPRCGYRRAAVLRNRTGQQFCAVDAVIRPRVRTSNGIQPCGGTAASNASTAWGKW